MQAQAIIILIDIAITALTKANELRNRLKQDKELTPEEEAALDKKFEDAFNQSHWQPTTQS